MNEALADLKLAKTPTPLAVFLYIYFAAHKECYPLYLDGAEQVYKWLSPIAIPPAPTDYRLPALLSPSYELVALAKVIVGDVHSNPVFDDWLTSTAKAEYAIYTTINTNSDIRKLL